MTGAFGQFWSDLGHGSISITTAPRGMVEITLGIIGLCSEAFGFKK